MRNYSKTVAKRKTKQKSFIVSLGLCGLGIQTGYSKDNWSVLHNVWAPTGRQGQWLKSPDSFFPPKSGVPSCEVGWGPRDVGQNIPTWSLHIAWASSHNGGWVQRANTWRGREWTRWILPSLRSRIASLLLFSITQIWGAWEALFPLVGRRGGPTVGRVICYMVLKGRAVIPLP